MNEIVHPIVKFGEENRLEARTEHQAKYEIGPFTKFIYKRQLNFKGKNVSTYIEMYVHLQKLKYKWYFENISGICKIVTQVFRLNTKANSLIYTKSNFITYHIYHSTSNKAVSTVIQTMQ